MISAAGTELRGTWTWSCPSLGLECTPHPRPPEGKSQTSSCGEGGGEGLLLLFSHSVTSSAFATPWTIARQAPLSMEFSRQEYWSGLSYPSPGDLPDPGIEPVAPALAGGFLTTEKVG